MRVSSCPRRHPDAAYKIVEGEALIVVPGGEAAHHVLNEVGACIWELLDGEHDLPSIRDRLVETFQVEKEEAARDLEEFLEALDGQGMLAPEPVAGGGTA
ncbi:MAG: PqqD family protein [Acidobacteriota bacterium]